MQKAAALAKLPVADNLQNLAAITNWNDTRLISRQLPGVLRIPEDCFEKLNVPQEYYHQVSSISNHPQKYPDMVTTDTVV
jgi:hypothetical protein